jgi:hypothetical protein
MTAAGIKKTATELLKRLDAVTLRHALRLLRAAYS